MLYAHWNIGQKHGCIFAGISCMTWSDQLTTLNGVKLMARGSRLAVPLVKICSAESAKKKSSQTYIFLYVALTDKRPC